MPIEVLSMVFGIEEKNPLKQGLKRSGCDIMGGIRGIEEKNPLKQGLKQKIQQVIGFKISN